MTRISSWPDVRPPALQIEQGHPDGRMLHDEAKFAFAGPQLAFLVFPLFDFCRFFSCH
ncbi:MAG: hypothetical protein H6559_13685 [Lewinellaceae bacterium]|nr:hypothetical protein [Lewinellaceae bacterium]